MKTFQSRHLQHGIYSPSTLELTIIFTNGVSEVRTMVPRAVWQGLSKANSPGRFYHANIKNTYPIKRDKTNANDSVRLP